MERRPKRTPRRREITFPFVKRSTFGVSLVRGVEAFDLVNGLHSQHGHARIEPRVCKRCQFTRNQRTAYLTLLGLFVGIHPFLQPIGPKGPHIMAPPVQPHFQPPPFGG